jgi:hypothetical protein
LWPRDEALLDPSIDVDRLPTDADEPDEAAEDTELSDEAGRVAADRATQARTDRMNFISAASCAWDRRLMLSKNYLPGSGVRRLGDSFKVRENPVGATVGPIAA